MQNREKYWKMMGYDDLCVRGFLKYRQEFFIVWRNE